MATSKEILQDKALADLKLCFQILEEIHSSDNKSKLPIFENSLRFSFQELARSLQSLNEISPDSQLLEISSFLTPAPATINLTDLQPKLLALQKYLLATLL